MKATAYILGLLLIFIGVFLWAFTSAQGLSGGLSDIAQAAKTPAIAVVLADLYIGFLILVGWVFYREGAGLRAILISAAIVILGNIAALIYILVLLIRARGDVWDVLLGQNK